MFNGRGSPFLDFERHVFLWVRSAETKLASRASLLVLRMRPAPRQVCLAAGGDYLDDQDGAARLLGVLRKFFPPDAAGAIRQRVMRFTHFRRAEHSIDEFVVEFDSSGRTAESNMRNSFLRYRP